MKFINRNRFLGFGRPVCAPLYSGVLLIGILVHSYCGSSRAQTPPRYMQAVRQELSRLGYATQCSESAGTCGIQKSTDAGSAAETASQILFTFDDASAIVRISIENFIESAGVSPEMHKQLLELNHSLVVARLSLNRDTGAVALSAVINTDSNFDRKTFRSVFAGFLKVAVSLRDTLRTKDPSGNGTDSR